ncbi:hypothetical protein ANN_04547 [Periplaneta americana]|uniref:Reverse transcriptase zinc-binding domain-containing protein n=1 Tax=Periplaneta americana TaxID=6978 RepID=A0ABQ8T8V4_PERAM|nr:hypothetical protein ANN_04547 [Periplaneta americana]
MEFGRFGAMTVTSMQHKTVALAFAYTAPGFVDISGWNVAVVKISVRNVNINCSKTGLNLTSDANKTPLMRQLSQEVMGQLLKDIPPESRRLAVASFRLNTEHDILGKHLNRLGILPSASCILCHQQEDMDRQHLAKCPALKSSKEVDRYWEARARMFLIT